LALQIIKLTKFIYKSITCNFNDLIQHLTSVLQIIIIFLVQKKIKIILNCARTHFRLVGFNGSRVQWVGPRDRSRPQPRVQRVGSDPRELFYNTSVSSGNGEMRGGAWGSVGVEPGQKPNFNPKDGNNKVSPRTEIYFLSLLFSSNLGLLCYISEIYFLFYF
jgi:hypothetical protein